MHKRPLVAWWNTHTFEAIVFVTGAAILVVEVTATRILSPYYGNTIFTVSSVIGVILGALSFGYWKGGIEADKHPDISEFHNIIYQGGLSLAVLFLLVIFILPIGGQLFSLQMGPLIWSLILFFPSSYLMGKLSPFAITLAAKEDPARGLGHITGAMFFWSTAGSILGSLATGFIFIPHMGVRTILLSTTIIVLLLGGIGSMIHMTAAKRQKRVVTFIFLLLILFMAAFIAQGKEGGGSIFMKDGVYEKLTVVDAMYAGKPARFFLQDHSGSGGMALESETLLFDYTKYYALYQLVQPKLAHALFIGGGVYSMPKALYNESPETHIDVVDIEPGLETIAKKYFRLPETPMITTHTADGRRFLSDSTTPYDLIFSDVYYSLYSIPSHITTKEFFETVREKLAPNGIFLANIIGSTEHTSVSLLFSEIRTMREVFPNMEVIAVDSATSSALQNFILVGINGTSTLRAGLLHYEGGDVTLEHLSEHLLPLSDLPLGAHEILTDNFAPVEHLVANLITTSALTEEHGPSLSAALLHTLFSGEDALHDIERIVKIGSRAIGTPGHDVLARALEKELSELTAQVVIQSWEHRTKDGRIIPLTNIVARLQPENPHRILVGTHYDSIARAYRDKKNPDGFMPGANNSASGVAVLLELARKLRDVASSSSVGVDLVFFDGEEGELALGAGDPNWSPLGSTYFVSKLATLYPKMLPHTGIILDMVCDRDLSLSPEKISSDFANTRVKSFWGLGTKIAPASFHMNVVQGIGDDQVPLNNAGIPSFLVIDFNYEPWFNTTEDTPDKCSADSLTTVGRTVEAYIKTR